MADTMQIAQAARLAFYPEPVNRVRMRPLADSPDGIRSEWMGFAIRFVSELAAIGLAIAPSTQSEEAAA